MAEKPHSAQASGSDAAASNLPVPPEAEMAVDAGALEDAIKSAGIAAKLGDGGAKALQTASVAAKQAKTATGPYTKKG